MKRKVYGQAGRYDLLPRWGYGQYCGPAWGVRNGSVVLMEETNRFTVTTHLRSRLKEDEEDKEEIKAEMDLAVPTTRVRKKSSLRQLDGPPPPKKHVTWDLRDEII